MPKDKPALKSENQALTEKELMFVERYMTHWNSARAAREAGYCEMNPGNAKIAGLELRNKPYIQNAIDNRMRLVCMDANEALARLAEIARGDIIDFLTKNNRGEWEVDLDKAAAANKTHLIKSYNQSRLGPANIELYSAVDALDKIAKHLNLFRDENKDVSMSLSAWAMFVKSAQESANKQPADASVTNAAPYVDTIFVNEETNTIEFDVIDHQPSTTRPTEDSPQDKPRKPASRLTNNSSVDDQQLNESTDDRFNESIDDRFNEPTDDQTDGIDD